MDAVVIRLVAQFRGENVRGASRNTQSFAQLGHGRDNSVDTLLRRPARQNESYSEAMNRVR
jgi:hypothetical protein